MKHVTDMDAPGLKGRSPATAMAPAASRTRNARREGQSWLGSDAISGAPDRELSGRASDRAIDRTEHSILRLVNGSVTVEPWTPHQISHRLRDSRGPVLEPRFSRASCRADHLPQRSWPERRE